MRTSSFMRNKYFLLLAVLILLIFTAIYFRNQLKENLPYYQFKKSIIADLQKYTKEYTADDKDIAQDFYYYFNRESSISAFLNAVRNSKVLSQKAYMASNPPQETTSETFIIVLPCIDETFLYYSKYLFCRENDSIFAISKKDSQELFEIIRNMERKK